MAVISFCSLKGGVGKTSLALNIAAAFQNRKCSTLLIDTDPLAHTTRFFKDALSPHSTSMNVAEAAFQALEASEHGEDNSNAFNAGLARVGRVDSSSLVAKVGESLFILPGGEEYKYFTWGKGARAFVRFFADFIKEAAKNYDMVIIDTEPDFNVVTRAVIGGSDIVVVPIDASAMSIHGLEALVEKAEHIEGPSWCIARTMRDKRATRVNSVSEQRVGETVAGQPSQSPAAKLPPLYLLDTIIHRTEQQNMLSFVCQTAFSSSKTSELASLYYKLAGELEGVLAIRESGCDESLPLDL